MGGDDSPDLASGYARLATGEEVQIFVGARRYGKYVLRERSLKVVSDRSLDVYAGRARDGQPAIRVKCRDVFVDLRAGTRRSVARAFDALREALIRRC